MTSFIVVTDNGTTREARTVLSRCGMEDAAAKVIESIGVRPAGHVLKGHYYGRPVPRYSMELDGLSITVYKPDVYREQVERAAEARG